jgi:hypothetical protein
MLIYAAYSQIIERAQSISRAFPCTANIGTHHTDPPDAARMQDLALFMRAAARCLLLQTNPDCCLKSAADIVRNERMEALPFLLDQRSLRFNLA